MRLFFAISLSQSIQEKLFAIQKEFFPYQLEVRWTEPFKIHLTLAFLDWQEEEKIKKLFQIGQKTALSIKPFTITLDKLGAFPSLKNPRVIWVGLKENKKLENLYQNLKENLKKEEFPVESRPFSAHLTLGRVKGKIPNFPEILEKINLRPLKKASFEVFSFELFESILRPKGAEYKILNSFNFLP